MPIKQMSEMQSPLHGQRPYGMHCPICRGFMPVSIHDLIYKNGIECPHCGLQLTINKMQSKRALDALKKIEQACDRVDETRTFRG